jgi:predicted CopG family antitoxin
MIRVSEETYESLKKIKVHPRETWDEVVRRLLEAYKKSRGVS